LGVNNVTVTRLSEWIYCLVNNQGCVLHGQKQDRRKHIVPHCKVWYDFDDVSSRWSCFPCWTFDWQITISVGIYSVSSLNTDVTDSDVTAALSERDSGIVAQFNTELSAPIHLCWAFHKANFGKDWTEWCHCRYSHWFGEIGIQETGTANPCSFVNGSFPLYPIFFEPKNHFHIQI
jgi:hypothetical protein